MISAFSPYLRKLKLPSFIQLGKLPIYSSCCLILRVDKILKSFGRFPTFFQVGLLWCTAVYYCSGAASVCTEVAKKFSKILNIYKITAESAKNVYGKRRKYVR